MTDNKSSNSMSSLRRNIMEDSRGNEGIVPASNEGTNQSVGTDSPPDFDSFDTSAGAAIHDQKCIVVWSTGGPHGETRDERLEYISRALRHPRCRIETMRVEEQIDTLSSHSMMRDFRRRWDPMGR